MDMDKLAAAMGPVVKTLVSREAQSLIERNAELEARIKELEEREPEKGEPGADGLPGADGKDGEHGKDGIAPSAEDVAACFERRFSEFLLAGERRIYEMADKAIDRMPRAKDGIDGIGWDAMSVEFDGERTVTLVFDKGEEQFTYPVTFPLVIDKGFWKDGTQASQGDGYTFGGSYWIAQKATDTKPEVGNDDWRIAVRKGRDAKSSARVG